MKNVKDGIEQQFISQWYRKLFLLKSSKTFLSIIVIIRCHLFPTMRWKDVYKDTSIDKCNKEDAKTKYFRTRLKDKKQCAVLLVIFVVF